MSRGGRLRRVDLLAFASPVILFQAIELAWRSYLPAFFATTLAFPLGSVAMLLLLVRLFDGAIDPFIGWMSDRIATPLGKRRPWLLLGAPLVSLGALGIFWATPGTGLASLAAASLIFHLGYTLIATPHGGWGLELSPDPHQRVRAMGAKVWLGSVGMIGTLLLPSLLERFGIGRAAQIGALGAAILLLAPATVALVLSRTAEPEAPQTSPAFNPFRLFVGMVRTPAVRRILILYGLVGVADAAAAGSFLFFVEQGLALPGWGNTAMLVQGIAPLAALPLWARLSRRFGKRRILRGAFLWQALVTPIALLLPSHSLAMLLAWLAARSLTSGVDYMLLRALVSDVASGGMAHGERATASRYALFNVTLRIAMGLGIVCTLSLLAWTGFTPNAPASEEVLFAVRTTYALPATIAALIACALLWPEARPATTRRGRSAGPLDVVPG